MRCLLIDDDIPTIEALCQIINWSKYKINDVLTANNIHEAKSIVEAHQPDLIICDIEMPRGSGIDMLKWIRSNNHDCQFIFLTCHESFEFASIAISYHVDSYLTKPLDKQKLDETLVNSIQKLNQRKMLEEYQRLRLTWIKNKEIIEKNFWRDILMGYIAPRKDIIFDEIEKRDLLVSANTYYIISLISVHRSQISNTWDSSIFQYALTNLCSEILTQQVEHDRVISYQSDHSYYVAYIQLGTKETDRIKHDATRIINDCKQYLKCTATCYISERVSISELLHNRRELEYLDNSNIIFRGIVHLQNEPFQYNTNTAEPFALDFETFSTLFMEKEKVKIVNELKKELEILAAHNKLDAKTLHSIREDFLQVVYSFLSSNYIQAHRLFPDGVLQKLLQNAETSVFDFMKWAYAVTDKTIEYVNEVVQSEGIIEKAKRFIHENYTKNLSREDVAASVFLTADYLAKVFKIKTGLTIKEYVNDCRIKAAKQMLIESNDSVGYIAMETGFESISYFSTVFKKLTGETPNLYRSKFKRN